MPQQQLDASELDHAKEVFDVVLIASDDSAEPMHPGKQSFYFPPPLVSPKLAPVLCLGSSAPVGSNHFDVIVSEQLLIQLVRIVSFVPDQSRRELFEEAAGEHLFDQLAFCGRSTLDTDGERKTVISGDSDDLGALPATRRSDGKPPFLALANVASTKASSISSLPRFCNCFASRRNALPSLPSRTHCWNRRWQVWNGGYFSGNSRHCAPVPNTHRMPFNTARVSCQGRPRLSARRLGRKIGSSSAQSSSLTSQRPCMARGRIHSRASPSCQQIQQKHRLALLTYL
jgi:hypothetical protein